MKTSDERQYHFNCNRNAAALSIHGHPAEGHCVWQRKRLVAVDHERPPACLPGRTHGGQVPGEGGKPGFELQVAQPSASVFRDSPLSRALWIRLMMAAARWPARSEPANNQFERPTATGMDLKCFHGKAVPAQALVAARPAQGSAEPHSGIDCSQRYVNVDQAVLE